MFCEYEEKVVLRDELSAEHFGFLSIVFSDENLANGYVLKQLQTWYTNPSCSLIFITKKSLDIGSFIEQLYQKLPEKLLTKIGNLCKEEYANNSSAIEKMVCYKCKNIGSIISSRLVTNPIRFLCEKCEQTENNQTQSISDLIWSRRCNECSNTQSITTFNVIKGIKCEIDELLNDSFVLVPSMMTVKQNTNLEIITLSSLFTIKKYRNYGWGDKLIKFIPSIWNNLFSVSICTAGLESEFLFSK